MIECISPPSPMSARSSTTSVRRTCALLTRYSPSPPRCSRRAIESSENSSGPEPSSLSKRSSTSAYAAGSRLPFPAKSTSSGFSARSSLGLRLPAAPTTPAPTFDLPDPFGPTPTATPGSRRSSTGSGNDLKPRSLIALRCMQRAGYGGPRIAVGGASGLAGLLVAVLVAGERLILVGPRLGFLDGLFLVEHDEDPARVRTAAIALCRLLLALLASGHVRPPPGRLSQDAAASADLPAAS